MYIFTRSHEIDQNIFFILQIRSPWLQKNILWLCIPHFVFYTESFKSSRHRQSISKREKDSQFHRLASNGKIGGRSKSKLKGKLNNNDHKN